MAIEKESTPRAPIRQHGHVASICPTSRDQQSRTIHNGHRYSDRKSTPRRRKYRHSAVFSERWRSLKRREHLFPIEQHVQSTDIESEAGRRNGSSGRGAVLRNQQWPLAESLSSKKNTATTQRATRRKETANRSRDQRASAALRDGQWPSASRIRSEQNTTRPQLGRRRAKRENNHLIRDQGVPQVIIDRSPLTMPIPADSWRTN